MTSRDNQLTKRAINAGTQPLPTFPVRDLCVFLTALDRLGFQRQLLLSAAGLQSSVLSDPDARISCETFGAVLGCAAQQKRVMNLGVRIAAETSIGAFPLLDYLILTSETVGEGMEQLSRYFRLVGGPESVEIRKEENPVQVAVWPGNYPVSTEFTVSLSMLHLRKETDERFRSEYVSFKHRPDDVAEVEQILGCPLRSDAAWSGLAISRKNWDLPFRRRDPVLRALLEQRAKEMIAQLPVTDCIVFEVRRELAKRIAGRDTKIESVARALAIAPRTLQRRLAEAEFSYQELVELTRRDAAEKYLADRSLSIAEVAYLLGYSEPSALHRAFKRWKGVTPVVFRQSQYLAGLAAQQN